MVEYGDRLKEAMDDANVSISALAAHMKLSYQAVKKVLDGKTNAFNASNNDVAARHLGVSSSWLANGRMPKRTDAGAIASSAAVAAPAESSKFSPRATNLAQRFDALDDPADATKAFARLSNILDVYEAEQRERQHSRPEATAPTSAPRRRAHPTAPTR